jgi:acyl dehydratase
VAYAVRPFAKACTEPELAIVLLRLGHGEQEFEFFEVVQPGDVLTTTGKTTDISAKKNLDFLTVDTESHNQREALVVRARWTAVIRG